MQILACHYAPPWLGDVGIVSCRYVPGETPEAICTVAVSVWAGVLRYEAVLALPLAVLEAWARILPDVPEEAEDG